MLVLKRLLLDDHYAEDGVDAYQREIGGDCEGPLSQEMQTSLGEGEKRLRGKAVKGAVFLADNIGGFVICGGRSDEV